VRDPSGELEHQTLTHHPHLSNSPQAPRLLLPCRCVHQISATAVRHRQPECQFARLATSGIPCFFPVRCASMFGPEGPKCPPWPGGLTGRSSTDSAGDWETGRGTGWREISRSRSPSGGRYVAERQDIESVCRALSTNVDRDLHTERELENACATSPIWQWQAHATCSGSCAGWGVCPHDGWDFSRCSPGPKGWEFHQ
jgi:hypothetical protein